MRKHFLIFQTGAHKTQFLNFLKFYEKCNKRGWLGRNKIVQISLSASKISLPYTNHFFFNFQFEKTTQHPTFPNFLVAAFWMPLILPFKPIGWKQWGRGQKKDAFELWGKWLQRRTFQIIHGACLRSDYQPIWGRYSAKIYKLYRLTKLPYFVARLKSQGFHTIWSLYPSSKVLSL